ncbi:hypothetical protein [Butyrivibrio sp. AC2005]|uniref:hypothetical protein n=1 Tax=Butyrivibrio sp. AC2005 TaxID=1280672 RepID=UPI00042A7981|nr:hypothetical protein [Butyrivibrio sp. AC2005]
MKRMNKKLMSVLCMAMTVFSMTTCDVKVSAAGYFYPSSQPKTTTESNTITGNNSTTGNKTTTENKTTTGNKALIGKEKSTLSSSSYLTTEQQSILNKLDTDYTKVNWGVQYSPKGMDGIIISVAPYQEGRYPYLLVAITNIYNEDVTFSATGYAKGQNGQEIADISFYEEAIRPGNTIAKAIYCDNTPTGEIHWDSIELPKTYGESTYWEGDWSFSTDINGYYQIDYTVKSEDYMTPGYVTTLLLDSYGNVIDVAYDYNCDKGYYVSDSIQFYAKDYDRKVVDVAMFTNPLIAK